MLFISIILVYLHNKQIEIMKTSNEKTVSVINGIDKGIYNEIKYWVSNIIKYDNMIGDTLIELISENSNNDSNKKLALELIDNDRNPNKEEAIELTYEISRNKSSYINLMGSYNDKCKDDAFDILKEIYPSKSDGEIILMIR